MALRVTGDKLKSKAGEAYKAERAIAAPYASRLAALRPRIVLLISRVLFFCPFVLLGERRARRKYGGKSEKQPTYDRAEVLREKPGEGRNAASEQKSHDIFVPFCPLEYGNIDRGPRCAGRKV